MLSVVSKVARMATSFYSWWVGVWKAKAVTISFTIFALMFLWVGLIISGPWLNTMDRQGWKCEIVSAETASGGMGLRGGSSAPLVVVHTKNCGRINVSGTTVNLDSKGQVAASFEPGSEWVFELGWYTRNFLMKVLQLPQSVQIYHRVN